MSPVCVSRARQRVERRRAGASDRAHLQPPVARARELSFAAFHSLEITSGLRSRAQVSARADADVDRGSRPGPHSRASRAASAWITSYASSTPPLARARAERGAGWPLGVRWMVPPLARVSRVVPPVKIQCAEARPQLARASRAGFPSPAPPLVFAAPSRSHASRADSAEKMDTLTRSSHHRPRTERPAVRRYAGRCAPPLARAGEASADNYMIGASGTAAARSRPRAERTGSSHTPCSQAAGRIHAPANCAGDRRHQGPGGCAAARPRPRVAHSRPA